MVTGTPMFSGTFVNELFNFFVPPGVYPPSDAYPFQMLGRSTEWSSGTFAQGWQGITGTHVGNIADIKLNGHWWDVQGIGSGAYARVEAFPILSGGATGQTGYSAYWDTYIPGENPEIHNVGQSMKNITHLIATYLADPGVGIPQVEMSFDHVFLAVYFPVD
jgi:hypothetical protein